MCNAVEINSLFGALGFVVPCPRAAKEQQVGAPSFLTGSPTICALYKGVVGLYKASSTEV